MSKIEWERIDVPDPFAESIHLRKCETCGELPVVTLPTHDTARSECKCRVMMWTPKGVMVYEK